MLFNYFILYNLLTLFNSDLFYFTNFFTLVILIYFLFYFYFISIQLDKN